MKKIILFTLLIVLCFNLDFQKFHKTEQCPFCDRQVLDAQIFYEGTSARAILTYKPAVPGHVLIIPNRHVERFEELSAEEIAAIGDVIKRVDGAVRGAFGNKDYVLLQKNGKGAGQNVPHVHFHYLPAAPFFTLRFFLVPWLKPLSAEELKQLKELLFMPVGFS